MGHLKIDGLQSSLLPKEIEGDFVYLLSMTDREGTSLVGAFKSEDSLKSVVATMFNQNLYVHDGVIYPIFKYAVEPLR